MKTICIDCRYVGSKPSGIGELVRALAEELPQMAPDLRFLLLRNPERSEPLGRAANVSEKKVRLAANGPGTMWWLPRLVDLRGVDLFHATFNIMPAGLPMPCLTTIHDVMWLTDPHWCDAGPLAHVRRLFFAHGITRALRRSQAIATVSRATRDAIAHLDPAAFARTRVTLSGVSADFRPVPRSDAALSGMGLPAGLRFILTVGQHAPYKNHEGALLAFAEAFGARTGIDLVMVQRQGPAGGALENLIDQLGLTGRVHLRGSLPRHSLMQLYGSAAALLHPSFCEGFGNPLAEAMACGCPIITSDVSAMPEVTDGAALLTNPRDTAGLAAALRRIVDDPALAAAMREKGLARAAQLSWREFARSNLDLYREMLAGA